MSALNRAVGDESLGVSDGEDAVRRGTLPGERAGLLAPERPSARVRAQAALVAVLGVGLLGLALAAWVQSRSASDGVSAPRAPAAVGEFRLPALGPIELPFATITPVATETETEDLEDTAAASWVFDEPMPRPVVRTSMPRERMPDPDLAAPVFASSAPSDPLSSALVSALQSPLWGTQAPNAGSVRESLVVSESAASFASDAGHNVTHTLPAGAVLSATLLTAIDSQRGGVVTAVLAAPVYDETGAVVLLPRGTQLLGQVAGELRAGQSRVVIEWQSARRPDGERVPLTRAVASDALGRAGLDGEVDRHTRDRLGAAVLLSLLEGAIDVAVAEAREGSGLVLQTDTGQSIATDVLRSTVNIAPTVKVAPGASLTVIVREDVRLPPAP